MPRSSRVSDETLDLGATGPPVLGDIPWGYGEDRITVMARDPHWLFAYWEITDESIAAARARVGAPHAGCVLRVYETTYRLFDGTNANRYFDIPVDRTTNNYYIQVDRPANTFHVDIGVKSHEGYFAEITRSGAVETPRDSIAPDARVEWMTVEPTTLSLQEYRHRLVRRPPAAPRHVGIGAPPIAELDRVVASLIGEGWTRTEWTEMRMGGRTVRWVSWSGPFRAERWWFAPPGPLTTLEFRFGGERQVIRLEHGEQVVVGPWHVAMYGVEAWGERRLLDRWTIHYAWPSAEAGMRIETPAILRRIIEGYRTGLVQAGSEALLMREAWASEWRWLGASEAWLGGASEMLLLGASGLGLLGGSAMIFLGASELALAGASELSFLGASEALGAREVGFLGASEGGGSEQWSWLPSSEVRP